MCGLFLKLTYPQGRYGCSSPLTKVIHAQKAPSRLRWDVALRKRKETHMNSVTRFDKNSPLGKSLEVFGKFLTVYFLFGKMLSLLWQTCDIIGQTFIFQMAKYWKKSNHLVTLVATTTKTVFCCRWSQLFLMRWWIARCDKFRSSALYVVLNVFNNWPITVANLINNLRS